MYEYMNSIFCCVFNHEKYVDMFFIMLESIITYGELDDNTDILVYTSTLFMNKIKQHRLFNNEKIKFEINDTYNTIDKACKARLDLFHLPSITKYEKILYLDTDVLIKDNINKVFDVCKEDLLYALEEGEINSDPDHWGKPLFGDEINNYDDKTAFTSGILLFNTSNKIKNLFEEINEDIVRRPHDFSCFDQPYIVYNSFKYNLYNNKVLKTLVVNNDNNVHSDKVIHHFPGEPGNYKHKMEYMSSFLNKLNVISLLDKTLHIETDVWTCSYKMKMDIIDYFISKKNYKIAEIGSYKGYTTKILSKIFSKVYAVDNNIERTEINKNFNKDSTNIEYVMLDIYNDNWNILPDDIEVSFIDAGHSYQECKSDILNSMRQFKNLQYIIFDDYGVWNGIKKIVDEMIERKILIFEKFIGLNDVPGPDGIVNNVNEGIICSINNSIPLSDAVLFSDTKLVSDEIINRSYSWENMYIKFLDNFKMDAFGEGKYRVIDKQNIIADFGCRTHHITFNSDYTEFSSTRSGDFQIVNGALITLGNDTTASEQ